MTPTTFPDLVPDPSTGKITYDVDNDGDGITDSVWLDLGYPARRDRDGQLYKPLFAFMVIGLNGRIPLNTAGNLAGQRSRTATTHAGTSATRSARSTRPTRFRTPSSRRPSIDYDPFNTTGIAASTPVPARALSSWRAAVHVQHPGRQRDSMQRSSV